MAISRAFSFDVRAALEQERLQLTQKLAELGAGEESSLIYDSNFADSSQVTAEKGEVEAISAPLRDALGEVEYSLSRLQRGEYGVCERCHEPISESRLEAVPTAKYCITCASRSGMKG